jgi:hypothetical protein
MDKLSILALKGRHTFSPSRERRVPMAMKFKPCKGDILLQPIVRSKCRPFRASIFFQSGSQCLRTGLKVYRPFGAFGSIRAKSNYFLSEKIEIFLSTQIVAIFSKQIVAFFPSKSKSLSIQFQIINDRQSIRIHLAQLQ